MEVMNWYSKIVEDLPVLVAAILILSIIGFTIYAYFCRDISLANNFFESMDAFATGVWGFLIGYGSGRVLGKRHANVEEAVEAAGTRGMEARITLLESEKNELRSSLEEAKETISRLMEYNNTDDAEGAEEDVEQEEASEK